MKNENLYTMKQPNLGKKISELRKKRGLTQEELVEQCNINVRTIQRIEAGEVTPRSFTLKNILNVLGSNIQDFSSDNLIHIDKKDLQKVKRGWFSGMLVTIISVMMIIGEIYMFSNNLNSLYEFSFRIVTSILLLVSLLLFLNSYRLIAIKSNNKTLKIATYFYWFLTLIHCLANVFLVDDEGFSRVSFFPFFLLMCVPFGLSEILLGLGIVKLKNVFGSFSQMVGILKIATGIILLSLLFSIIGIFLVIPVLILELVNLNGMIKQLTSANHS